MNQQIVPRDEAASLIGEGIHTSLRKYVDTPTAGALWNTIAESPDWDAAVEIAVNTLYASGFVLVSVADTDGLFKSIGHHPAASS